MSVSSPQKYSLRLLDLRKLMQQLNLAAYLVTDRDAHGSEYLAPCDRRISFLSGFTGSSGTLLVTQSKAFLLTDSRYALQAKQQLDSNFWQQLSGTNAWDLKLLKKLIVESFDSVENDVNVVGAEVSETSLAHMDEAAVLDNKNLSHDLQDNCNQQTLVPGLPEEASTTTTNTTAVQSREIETEGVVSNGNDNSLKTVGIDSSTVSVSLFLRLQKLLLDRGISLTGLDTNLVDTLWGSERPARTSFPLTIMPISFAGVFWNTKVFNVIEVMKENNVALLLVSALDEIAWLLNLRGCDIPNNPVFFAYILITQEGIHLFMDELKLKGTVGFFDHLTSSRLKTSLHNYENIYETFEKLVSVLKGKVWICPETSQSLYECVKDKSQVMLEATPLGEMKMCKTVEEIAGMRRAHINDSIAICRYLYFMYTVVKYGNRTLYHMKRKELLEKMAANVVPVASLSSGASLITDSTTHDTLSSTTTAASSSLESENNAIGDVSPMEYICAEILESFRSEEAEYVGPSFDTISAVGPNAAIVHYKPQIDTQRPITSKEIYLFDSGGQYLSGTTDVTRTIHFGHPSEEIRIKFTLVLKGHIALARAVFPKNTLGSSMDAFAKMYLWQHGLNYGHGTGHGVGAFLNVHEGPCGISSRSRSNEAGLKQNVVITIEPGYYKEGEYGIRIENVYVVTPASDVCANNSEVDAFLRFEPLTLVPIQTKLIVRSLLSNDEISWINSYHRNIREILSPILQQRNMIEVDEWLSEETQPI